MDAKALQLAGKLLVSSAHFDAAMDSMRTDESIVRSILAQRKGPEAGLSDILIEHLLSQLALMDSNNFTGHHGAGEREGRVFSPLVLRRHFHMSHGIGRSGDLAADQPKACGSSIMYKVTNLLVLDALRMAGVLHVERALVVPMATGMTLSLVLRAVSGQRPATAKFVVWPRMDQRTSLKCIEVAGFKPHVVPLRRAEEVREGPSVFFRVDARDVESAIDSLGIDNVVCVLSTTSCFAPRLPDDTLAIARVCKKLDVPYVVNNAYGVQSAPIMKRLDAAVQHGRLDAIVQSGDKNFLVPVGGAVVCGPTAVVEKISDLYAGRASASPIADLFITLLSMGRGGFRKLLTERGAVLEYFKAQLLLFASERGESLLAHPLNDISLAVTMSTIPPGQETEVGAKLFRHCVTGPKVVVLTERRELCGVTFEAYGSHSADTEGRVPMIVMACGIGMTEDDVNGFMRKLREAWPSDKKV